MLLKSTITCLVCLFLNLNLITAQVDGTDTEVRSALVPNASKHEVSYEEEYEAFQEDLISSIPSKSRSKRFIYLNSDTSSACALLLGFPLTIVLPSLSNVFNKWRRRRSVRDTEYLENNYEDDPEVQPHLDKISTYFELVDVSRFDWSETYIDLYDMKCST
jgi:hypothetical protein